jgi:hypothetical protein
MAGTVEQSSTELRRSLNTVAKLSALDAAMDAGLWAEYCQSRREKVWPRPSLSRMMLLGRARLRAHHRDR